MYICIYVYLYIHSLAASLVSQVNAIQYYTEELQRLNLVVEQEQLADRKPLHSGFVTFNSLAAASMTMQCQVR